MNIEHFDQLSTWLVRELTPICDAEPAALAKYVLALIRKPEKTEEELKEFCLDQLTVFLQGGTRRFTEKLFTTLKDRSYVVKAEPTPQQDIKREPVKENDSAEKEKEREKEKDKEREVQKIPSPPRERRRDEKEKDRREESRKDPGPSYKPVASSSRDEAPRRRPPPASGANAVPIETRRERRPITAPTASDTANDTPKEEVARKEDSSRDRPLRKRISPPPAEVKVIRDREVKRRSHSPARERRGGRSSRRSPTRRRRSRSHSRSRSRSGERERRERKRRCKDFDEQGFCMRAENCPFDHGIDPLIMDDSALDNIVKISTNAKPLPNLSVPPPGYNPPPPGVDASSFLQPPPNVAAPVEGYNPEAPALAYNIPPPPLPVHVNQHWRIPYGPSSAGYDPMSSVPVDPSSASVMRGGGGHSRGRGGRHSGAPATSARGNNSRSLYVKKIPVEKNTIAKLNEHFAAFGNVTNIQVRFHNEHDAALITYATRPEAVAAYKSPQPVLNNRFIRLFWFNPAQGETPPAVATGSNRTALSSGVKVDAPVVAGAPPILNEPPSSAGPVKIASVEESKFVSPSFQEERTKQVDARKKIKAGKTKLAQLTHVYKKQNELLDKLIATQKQLLTKLKEISGDKANEEKKSKLAKLAKLNSEKITKAKTEAASLCEQISRLSAEIKELDSELVKMAPLKVSSTNDNAEVPTRKRAASTGLSDDDEPKKKPSVIVVKGFDTADEQDLVLHFEKFGSLLDVDFVPGTSGQEAVVTYRRKPAAQKALASGAAFKGVQLNMCWEREAVAAGDVVVPDGKRSSDQQLTANQLLASIPKSEESDEEN